MWDVACLGELFIDLTPHSKVEGQWLYAPSPGGAPGNVAVGLARLGRKALMLSRVGNDAFGRLLVDALAGHGVDTSGAVLSDREKTGLSVVTLAEDGDRAFMFYHDQPADLHIAAHDISETVLRQSRMLHVGVLPLSGPISAVAQRKAMAIAEQAGIPISCDVNFRPKLWPDPADMIRAGRELISRSTIVKVSEEELFALGIPGSMDEVVHRLWHDKLRLFSVTCGAAGAVLYTRHGRVAVDGFKVQAIDTTGAGDAYTASVLSDALSRSLDEITEDEASLMLRRACAAGASAATKKGAMSSLPDGKEIDGILSAQVRPRN